MSRLKILQEDATYSFHSYFELPNDTDEILAEFGYSLKSTRLQLPSSDRPIENLSALQQQLEATLMFGSPVKPRSGKFWWLPF